MVFRGPSPATLEEVARRAGVSPGTVSRILNGTVIVRESTLRRRGRSS